MFESWPVRKLVERLPDPPSGWTPLVQVLILVTGNYKIFVEQCRSNTLATKARREGQTSTLGQVIGWHRHARLHYKLAVGFCLYNLVKYRLLALVRRDAPLGQLQYLDCILLGRFRYLGRTNKIGDQVTSVFSLWFLIYRLLVHMRMPKFKFFMFEFLLASQKEVEHYESQADQSGTLVVLPSDQSTTENKFIGIENKVNSLYYLRNQFNPHVPNKWILRPNRTSESWLDLTLALKFMCYWSLSVFAGSFVMLYWAIGGSVLTNFGFEMSYPTCVAWLRDVQQATSPDVQLAQARENYSYIYLAPKVLAHELRIDDVPARMPFRTDDLHQATSYGWIRLAFDIIENHLIYFEYVLLFVSILITLIVQAIDVILNATGIRARLLSVLSKLEARQSGRNKGRGSIYSKFVEASTYYEDSDDNSSQLLMRRTNLTAHYNKLLASRRRKSFGKSNDKQAAAGSPRWIQDYTDYKQDIDLDEHLDEEICNLQAILVDHFDTITRGYNRFVSYLLGLLGLCWLHFTLVVCVWMSSIRSRAVEFEFVLAEANITYCCLIYLSGAALIRSRNMQLYPLIARAMALDPDLSQTKLRWATILKYFHPRPFYCFTVLDNTEISWLFCLKLLSWIVSAFILLANFVYMYRF